VSVVYVVVVDVAVARAVARASGAGAFAGTNGIDAVGCIVETNF